LRAPYAANHSAIGVALFARIVKATSIAFVVGSMVASKLDRSLSSVSRSTRTRIDFIDSSAARRPSSGRFGGRDAIESIAST